MDIRTWASSGTWVLTFFSCKIKNHLRVSHTLSPSLCFTETGFWFSHGDPAPLLVSSPASLSNVNRWLWSKWAEALRPLRRLMGFSPALSPPLRSSSATTISSPNRLWKPLLFWLLIFPEFNYTVRWTLRLGGWPRVKNNCYEFNVWRKPWDGCCRVLEDGRGQSFRVSRGSKILLWQSMCQPPTGLMFMSKHFPWAQWLDKTKRKLR